MRAPGPDPAPARLVDAIAYAVVVTDHAGLVVEWNAAATALYGHDAAAARGRPFADLVPARTVPAGAPPPVAVAGRYSADWLTRAPDGGARTVHVEANPVVDDAGRATGTAWVAHDVTAERTDQAGAQALAALVGASHDVIIVTDLAGTIVSANAAAELLLGYAPHELVGRPIETIIPPQERAVRGDTVAEILAGRRPGPGTTTRLRKDGSLVPVSLVLSPVHDIAGDVRWITAIARDISAEVAAQDALRAAEARYRAIADTAQEGIWAADRAGRTLYANRKAAEILGLPLDALYERAASEALARPGHDGGADGRADRGADMYEIAYAHPDGTPRILRVSTTPFDEGAGIVGSLAMVSNVTAERRAEEELRRRALRDEVTGLANAALLDDRLRHAIARAERDGESVALLLLDLDGFRTLRARRGHADANAILAHVARRLAAAAREADTVARIREDHFAVVCEGTGEAGARELAHRLLAALAVPFPLDGGDVTVTASIGVAVSPPCPPTRLRLLADTALGEAQARGGANVTLYEAGRAAGRHTDVALSDALRAALDADALSLVYQPIVELATGRLHGVEALARWTDPHFGVVPPDRFLPVAEAAGLMGELDRWVVTRACRDHAALCAAAGVGDLRVSVNVSPNALADHRFEGAVRAAVTEHEVPPGALAVEITESAILGEPETAAGLFDRLRDHGVAATIDDFGTGYSSLGSLGRLALTSLKIDRSFVDCLGRDKHALAVTASIVDLSRTMSLDSVAEGVETPEQLDVLRSLGCTAAQGFLWSGGLDVAALGTLLDELPRGTFAVRRAAGEPVPVAPRRRDRATVEHGVHELIRLRRAGASPATIAAALNNDGYRTPRGLRWHRVAVAEVLADLDDRGTDVTEPGEGAR